MCVCVPASVYWAIHTLCMVRVCCVLWSVQISSARLVPLSNVNSVCLFVCLTASLYSTRRRRRRRESWVEEKNSQVCSSRRAEIRLVRNRSTGNAGKAAAAMAVFLVRGKRSRLSIFRHASRSYHDILLISSNRTRRKEDFPSPPPSGPSLNLQ